MTAPSENIIVIFSIGDCENDLLVPIGREVQRIFGFPTERVPLLKDVEFALDLNRGQYHSTHILSRLEELIPSQALKVLAVTDVDLFIPILTHVYGEAQLGGKTCIISTCRLKEGLSPLSFEQTYPVRVVKEAIHELGHTFKLRHCQDPICIMHYCRIIKDVDRKSDRMCRYCRVLIDDEIKRLTK